MVPAERPRRYFAFHYRMLRLLGLGWWHDPDEGSTSNFPSFYLPYSILTQFLWVVCFVGLETIDPFIGNKEVERFMFSLSFVITHDLTIVKLYLFYFRNQELQAIVKSLEIEMYLYYQNDDKNRRAVRTTRMLTVAYLFFGVATIANSNINGAIQDFRWKAAVRQLNENMTKPERMLAQPIYIPWNYQGEKVYIATFILEAVGLLWTGHIVMIIDTFIGGIVIHMCTQFRTLQEAIETFYDRTMIELRNTIREDIEENLLGKDKIDDIESYVRAHYSQKYIEDKLETGLNNCIRQHQVLIRCVQKFAQTYSYGFLTQLLSSMAAICVIMVQVSTDASSFKSVSFATSLAFFVCMILQLAIQCFSGNELTIQSGRVAEAVAKSRWESLPPRLRKQLIFMMAQAQRPLKLTAGGFAHMDNRCFLSIVKAAYSYYAVLSQKEE